MGDMRDTRGHWLIDGMNLIGSRPNRWWKDPDAAIRDLIERLEDYAAATGEPVTVVFDYRPKGLRAGTGGGVKARFASGGPEAADLLIAEMLGEHPDPQSYRVVTSDGALRRTAEAAGAEVVGAGTFRTRLDEVTGNR